MCATSPTRRPTRSGSRGGSKLPSLISRETAGDLLARAKAILGENADDKTLDERHRDFAGFRDYYRISDVDDRFRAFRLSPVGGRNAAKLLAVTCRSGR